MIHVFLGSSGGGGSINDSCISRFLGRRRKMWVKC